MSARRQGDEAFADWLGPHLAALRRISRAFAPPADQNDLLQELMLAVWRARPQFEDRSAAATFVYRVAHNAALTWKRGETRRLRRRSGTIASGASNRRRSTGSRPGAPTRAMPMQSSC